MLPTTTTESGWLFQNQNDIWEKKVGKKYDHEMITRKWMRRRNNKQELEEKRKKELG